MRSIPLPPLRRAARACPKCGADGLDVTLAYCGDDQGQRHSSLSRVPLPHPGAEALHCACDRCGFAWVAPTLDADGRGR